MNRPEKIVRFSLLLMPALMPAAFGMAGGSAHASSPSSTQRAETIIYKHVDENGRVTYANSPIKGGARIDLDPITVIPSSPSGSLNPANAQVVSPRPASTPTPSTPANQSVAIVSSPTAPLAKPAVQLATVLPLSSRSQGPLAKPVSLPAQTDVVASLDAMNQLTMQRRADTRKHLLEGELQTEEQSLVSARSKLQEEQKLSGGIRAMRASFAATAEAITAQKPLISPETRVEIERHFERIRNLQDQVAMHENQLQTLREKANAPQ